MKKAIGYCRVSTDEQVIDGNSLEVQEREIREYCSNKNIELKNIYIDMGVSAYKNLLKDRPQGYYVVEHIINKDIDCVIATSDDRMFRNVADSAVMNDFIKNKGIDFIYTRQQHYNSLSPQESLIITTISSMTNQLSSLGTSVKVKSGILDKIKRGEWNGPAPYGYRLVNSHLVIEEEEANIVRLIYNLYTEQFMGFSNICDYLNTNNIITSVKSVWSKSSVGCILKNEVYTGKTVYNRRAGKGKGVKFNDESEWLYVNDTHEPIISQEQFNITKEMLSTKRKQSGVKNISRSNLSFLPLGGKIICGNCKNIYTGSSGVSKKRGKIYYYMCVSHKRYGKSVCRNHMIPAELLEKFVLYRIKDILTSDMYKKHFEEQLKKSIDSLKAKKKDISNINANISKLIKQKDKLLTLIIEEDNKAILDTYKEKLNAVLNQLEQEKLLLNTYNALDIESEEKLLKEQFRLEYNDITYKDFQDLDRRQLKLLFNELIDTIEIKEFEFSGDNNKNKLFPVVITINMKISGYSPKYTLNCIKTMKTEDIEKQNPSFFLKTEELNIGGGEGGI